MVAALCLYTVLKIKRNINDHFVEFASLHRSSCNELDKCHIPWQWLQSRCFYSNGMQTTSGHLWKCDSSNVRQVSAINFVIGILIPFTCFCIITCCMATICRRILQPSIISGRLRGEGEGEGEDKGLIQFRKVNLNQQIILPFLQRHYTYPSRVENLIIILA